MNGTVYGATYFCYTYTQLYEYIKQELAYRNLQQISVLKSTVYFVIFWLFILMKNCSFIILVFNKHASVLSP